MPDWAVERLASSHDRSSFDCGEPVLTTWLRARAGQFDRRDLARTFVAIRPGEATVFGYYAISTHRVIYDALPPSEGKGLPRLDVPTVLIGRLAVERSVQGQGLGEILLIDALRRSATIAEQVGVRAVEVEAIDDRARRFYEKYGFRSLQDEPRHLFMPMHEVRKLELDPL